MLSYAKQGSGEHMANREHIVEAFENYLDSARPGHALMITGEWGSGKTYFWKTVLDTNIERKHRHRVLVSLYGVKTQDDFERQVVASIYPFLKSGLFKTLKAALDKWLGFGLSLFRLDPQLHMAVFCFDDFERVAMPHEQALGYINRFIEQYGSHVLILANEQSIAAGSPYWTMKEKVVGKTYSFEPNVAETIASIVSELGDKKHSELQTRISIVQNSVSKSTPVNLRSVILAVDNCNFVMRRLDGQPRLPLDVLDTVVHMVAACTIEEKSSKKTLQQLRALFVEPNSWYFLHYAKREEEKSSEALALIEGFAGKYFDGNIDNIPTLTAILDFVETGCLDVEALHLQAIGLRKPINDEPADLRQLFLKDPLLIPSDKELLDIAAEYLQKVEKNAITNATDLSVLFFTLEFLAEHRILSQTQTVLLELFLSSIKAISAEGRFHRRDFAGYIGLSRFVEPVSESLKEVVSSLTQAQIKVEEAVDLQRIADLLLEMESDFESFMRRILGYIEEDGFDYPHKPLFASMNHEVVAKTLAVKSPKEIRQFESLMRQRYYRVINIKDFLEDEHGFLLAFAESLKKSRQEAGATLRGVALGMLRNVVLGAAEKVADGAVVVRTVE